jgi:predicted metalloprotease with PDZ domain
VNILPKSFRAKWAYLLVLVLLLGLAQSAVSQSKTKKPKKGAVAAVKPAKPVAPPEISYTVSMSKPWTHLLEVEMRVRAEKQADAAELVMPVWTPGSYLVREYARHVQDFAVKDASGKELAWTKAAKNIWKITTTGVNEFAVSYRVYANELTVRTNELNDQHAFWNNTALLMHLRGQLALASTLKVNPYGDWKIATGLPRVEGQTNVFRAENYDVLYDSPFEVSNFKQATFEVKGVQHYIAVSGPEGNYDLNRMAADTKKIVEAGVEMFGGEIPYKDYTFILNLRGGGGLEHLNSTALQWNRWGFKPEGRYKDFLSLVAHEYFHLWNVKRIRPDALGPFDYDNENYTRLLWVAEGGTSYYENLLLVRAGIMSASEFLGTIESGIADLQRRPGRMQTSLEEASFDAWIKYYRQDENSINNQISYYDKGALVSALLDMEIRKASGSAKSLDDVFRYLYAEHFKKNKNYTPEDYQKISEMMAGKSLEEFFSKYVRGRTDIDYNSILNGMGLQLVTGAALPQRAFLGAEFATTGERLTVSSLPADTPAFEQGLNTGDQIVAVDGLRANQPFLQNYIAERKPGDNIRLTIFRFDEMRDLTVTLGGRSPAVYDIGPVDEPTEEQKRLFKDWLKADLVK